MTGALLTDLYEMTMAASYLRRGMHGPATFSLFVRRLPAQRGFLVAAGVEDCLAALESFRFDDEDLAWMRERLDVPDAVLTALRGLRFTGDVWAVPEGRIVLANEPILEVTAPIAQAQLVESILLNHVTFQTTIASKAARCRLAARGRELVDFSLRRTQGLAAAMQVARLSALVGFASTSNVAAARRYGLRAAGTMAHAYIEAFDTEEEAFRAFAADFPAQPVFLVDTYDTEAGVRTAARLIRELGLPASSGVRLDSGDLGALAVRARAILDAAGLPEARVMASGGLDEYKIARLVDSGAPIDVFAVGTRVGVSADAPSLDSAYKLVQYGDRPVLKLSPGKQTLPGRKQVFRRPGVDDLIALRDEAPPPSAEPLLEPVMQGGRRSARPSTLEDARRRFEADLAELPAAARRVTDPIAPTADISPALADLLARTLARTRAACLPPAPEPQPAEPQPAMSAAGAGGHRQVPPAPPAAGCER